MIYIDSSVALAQLMSERQSPPAALWAESLVSSRLLANGVWNRIHAYGLTATRSQDTHALIALVNLIEMSEAVLARAQQPFPAPVRTLEGLRLATIESLRARGEAVELAAYDRRLIAGAQALRLPLAAL